MGVRNVAVWAGVLVLAVGLLFFARYFCLGYRSPECRDQPCHSVSRAHFPFRHWQWSGIPPFEGGFIPDPHYIWSESASFSDPVSRMLPVTDSRYAIVDVNPAFNDGTSEILLLIQSRDSVFQYSLTFPKHQGVQAILAHPTAPPAMVFPYKNGLAVLVSFFGMNGIYILPLPLRSGAALDLIPPRSPEFAAVAAALKSVGQERTTREQFCESKRRDFIAFYEKYSGPCGGQSRAISEIESDFAHFWLQE